MKKQIRGIPYSTEQKQNFYRGNMKKALIIFSRLPIKNHTKTRLMPYLSPAKCVHLHKAILSDLSLEIKKLKNVDIFIYYDVPKGFREDISILRDIFGYKYIYKKQEGRNIGEKMYNAMLGIKALGYKAVVLVGSDIPQLGQADIEKAFASLRNSDISIGLTMDGGYYLIGMKEIEKEIFGLESYGNTSVAERTIARIKELHKSFAVIGNKCDVDTKEDIFYFRNLLRSNRSLKKTNFGKFLIKSKSISIIIPTYNEEKTIEKLQRHLYDLIGKCEIIFVDGGSSDKTVDLIDKRFIILHSKKGRSRQMNYGARYASGDILFFLHSDSELPQKSLERIRKTNADYRAACFGIAFRSLSPLMFICRYISNHRVFDRKVMFGDQGIFIDRDLFFDLGAFPDLPLMEDYELSLRLKKRGIRLGMTRDRIYTSTRRFSGNAYDKLKLMWKMNRLRKMYRDGVDIHKIASLYKDIR